MSKITIIGSGFSGLSAACCLAKEGHNVHILEKNSSVGGRARSYSEAGFTFDMGPSWYWMPDVFDQFFASFNKKTSDYYSLVKLDPGFQIVYENQEVLQIPASEDALFTLFEQIEKGSSQQLKAFLKEAEVKYNISMQRFVYQPCHSWMEFCKPELWLKASKLNMFQSVSSYIRKYFTNTKLISLLEFPVLFLGAMPTQIPALYTMMNHAALVQGTFYPLGGMVKIVEAMRDLAVELGVQIHENLEVQRIETNEDHATFIRSNKGAIKTDAILATADYHHVEQCLLQGNKVNYKSGYWEKKTFAPSCLIFYVGVSKKIKKLLHHNLFFDTNFEQHSSEIYASPSWPSNPLFYVCCPSKTDPSVAPLHAENLFLLVPIATGLDDSESKRESYFNSLIQRIEKHTGEDIKEFIIYKKSYCINDFIKDYNAFKGNAYGLANTLRQTAFLKPAIRNKKVKNLFYAGQLTVPGPGVPPAIISGQIAANETIQYLKKNSHHEITV